MIAWVWVLQGVAFAHRPGLSYARLDADHAALTFARPELATLVPIPDDLTAAADLFEGAILARASWSVAGAPCGLGPVSVHAVEGDGIEIEAPLHCPPGEVTYRAAFLDDLAVGHRHYVESGGEPIAVLDASAPVALYAGRSDRRSVALRFVGLGVEHIWTGYDHLLFLLGLLLAAASLRSMLLIVTGFTIAHSITLSLAALDLFTLPPGVVEPAIAFSIVYVGIENLWKPNARRRLGVTFSLGLVHGFGFAGMLKDLGLPRDALATALVCFNGGVELGQGALAAVTLPLLLVMRRHPWWERRVVPAVSVLVALAGAFWFVERLSG